MTSCNLIISSSLDLAIMCDLFWLSPSESSDQGDLSDVVRASLRQPAPHHHPADMAGLGSYVLQPDQEELLPEGGGGHGDLAVSSHGDDTVHGLGMMMMTRRPCDHGLLHSSSSQQRQPQVGSADVDVVAPETGDHLQAVSPSMAPLPPQLPAAIKPRKSQTKKVVCIPAPTAASGRASTSGGGGGGEVVPSDLWAWRKYGQKPIKGSPYPRGYYRCSSSKGCPARKQVERSRTDPNMLVITYTADHNHPWPTHRNALAGSTRPSSAATAVAGAGHHHQLKQEVLDADLELFAEMDIIFSTTSNNQLHRHLEDDTKQQQQLSDPFSSSFFDWASFGDT